MYKLGILSNDLELVEQLRKVDYFKQVKVGTSLEIIENDMNVLIISDRLMSANEVLQNIDTISESMKFIFYMISNVNYSPSVRSLLETKNVIVIAPKQTNNQIIDFIMKNMFDDYKNVNNIFTFFSPDNKTGTTMIAQSVAEYIASKTKKSVFLGFFSGKPGTDFLTDNGTEGLDAIKSKLIHKLLSFEELIEECIIKDNLYILKGAEYIPEIKYYQPEHIERLINLISNKFDVIILDAGSSVELNLSIGALNVTTSRFLVTTPQVSSFDSYKRLKEQVLDKLDIKDYMLVINKFINSSEIGTPFDIAKQYNTTLATAIPMLDWGWQSEKDRKSLLEYEDKEYTSRIGDICTIISNTLGLDIDAKEETKLPWFKKVFSKKG